MSKCSQIRVTIRRVVLVTIVTGVQVLVTPANAATDADGVRSRMLEILNDVSDLVKQNSTTIPS